MKISSDYEQIEGLKDLQVLQHNAVESEFALYKGIDCKQFTIK